MTPKLHPIARSCGWPGVPIRYELADEAGRIRGEVYKSGAYWYGRLFRAEDASERLLDANNQHEAAAAIEARL